MVCALFAMCVAGLLLEARCRWCLLKQLLLFCYLLSFTDASVRHKMLKREALSPATTFFDARAIAELPLPDNNLLSSPKHHHNRLSPHGAPAQPPNFGHFEISTPPSSSGLSRPSMEKSGSAPPSNPPPHVSEIAPPQPEPSTMPTGLSQPPLSPSLSSKIFILLNLFSSRTT